MIGTKRTYRSAAIILLGILLLAGSLLHRHILQTDASLPADAETQLQALSRGRSDPDRTSHKEAEIPAPDLVTAREIRGIEGGSVESVSWILPGDRVAGVLAALEVGYHASRYRGRIESGRWHVESVIEGEGERPPGTPGSEALQQAFTMLTGSATGIPPTDADTPLGGSGAAPSDASAARDGNTGTPDPDAGATRSGGSGYVLLRDRGRMHWMWNSDVLRLEPAR